MPWHPLRGICPSHASYDGIWNWDAAFHTLAISGWDNSVRWDEYRKRMGQLWPVDLNCCMVMAYRSMQYLARVTGHEADRGPFEAKERALADAVNRRLWDEARGCYADTGRDGTASRVLSPASFMPLFTGIATKPRARSMARIAADPARFFPGMPTVSYDDPKHKSSLRETILGWCARDPEALHEYYDSKTGAALRLRPRCG